MDRGTVRSFFHPCQESWIWWGTKPRTQDSGSYTSSGSRISSSGQRDRIILSSSPLYTPRCRSPGGDSPTDSSSPSLAIRGAVISCSTVGPCGGYQSSLSPVTRQPGDYRAEMPYQSAPWDNRGRRGNRRRVKATGRERSQLSTTSQLCRVSAPDMGSGYEWSQLPAEERVQWSLHSSRGHGPGVGSRDPHDPPPPPPPLNPRLPHHPPHNSPPHHPQHDFPEENSHHEEELLRKRIPRPPMWSVLRPRRPEDSTPGPDRMEATTFWADNPKYTQSKGLPLPPGFRNWDRHVPSYVGKYRMFSPAWNRTVRRQEQGPSYIWADGEGGYVRRDGTPVLVWPPNALDHINWFVDAFDRAEPAGPAGPSTSERLSLPLSPPSSASCSSCWDTARQHPP